MGQPTPFVAKTIGLLGHTPLLVLDLGCGRGRHALWLAALGHAVMGLDLDQDRIAALRRDAATMQAPVSLVVGNGARPLPFRKDSFELVLVVHFVAEGLASLVEPVIQQGGYLMIETFDGHGENWRDLPKPGQLRAELSQWFDLVTYRERLVGPSKREAAAVKLLARKR